MIRVLLAAAGLVFFAANLQAGGLDDLKAATTAAEQGKVDDAIGLYTKALAASDLSPADQFTAHKGRASGYTSKSLIADTFERLDQARGLRNDAIADFTAALKFKADDAAVYVARAQVYDLNGQYDSAIADFDAALKLVNSPATLIQRAGSLSAKGDTDRAVADYTAAIELVGKDTKGAKDAGIDVFDIYSARGYAQFIDARYAAAADDFDKALTLGGTARADDVLWLPYQAAWLHIARARAGQNDAEELTRNAGKIDVKQWPGTLIAYFLGQIKADQLSPPSSHGAMGRARECNLSFFTGAHALAKNDVAEATKQLTRARAVCNIHTVLFVAAGAELKRVSK
ncbi:MAG TPA: tetratricopeptide repeat protein [Pseudolabrys sp.]|jgi:tetratricopeptide (TPR) repeat protein